MIIEYMELFVYQNQKRKLGLVSLGKRKIETGGVEIL